MRPHKLSVFLPKIPSFPSPHWANSGEKVSAIMLYDIHYIIYTGNRQIQTALFLMPSCSCSNTTPIPCHCPIPWAHFPTHWELDALLTHCYFIGIENSPYPYNGLQRFDCDYLEYMLLSVLPVTTSGAKADPNTRSQSADHESLEATRDWGLACWMRRNPISWHPNRLPASPRGPART